MGLGLEFTPVDSPNLPQQVHGYNTSPVVPCFQSDVRETRSPFPPMDHWLTRGSTKKVDRELEYSLGVSSVPPPQVLLSNGPVTPLQHHAASPRYSTSPVASVLSSSGYVHPVEHYPRQLAGYFVGAQV